MRRRVRGKLLHPGEVGWTEVGGLHAAAKKRDPAQKGKEKKTRPGLRHKQVRIQTALGGLSGGGGITTAESLPKGEWTIMLKRHHGSNL